MSLGPQCLQCKKRRVKCGSEQPQCLKCTRDGYACPGYTKALVWVDATQPRSQKATNTSTKQKAWSLPLPSSARNHPDVSSVAQSGLPNLTRTLAQADKQTLDFMDAITFFEADLQPGLSATHWQTRYHITHQDWLAIPQFLQHGLIVVSLATRVLKGGTSSMELYSYRGKVIAELSRHSKQTSRKTLETTLRCLLITLQQEVHISPIADFKPHLGAASRCINACGGFNRCLQICMGSLEMVTSFMLVDVISATTTAIDQLPPDRVYAQVDYGGSIDDLDQRLLDSAFPAPLELFSIISRITHLRHVLFSASISMEQAEGVAKHLMFRTQDFEPGQWVKNLRCLPHDDAGLDFDHALTEWTTLATCYQLATFLYLTESCPYPRDSAQSSDPCAQVHSRLAQSLRCLFDTYPLRIATVGTPILWRFVKWPIMLYAYKTAMLGKWNSTESLLLKYQADEGTLYEELRQIGVYDASFCMVEGAEVLAEIARNGRNETWDENFSRACVFFL